MKTNKYIVEPILIERLRLRFALLRYSWKTASLARTEQAKTFIANILYLLGFSYQVSTFIDEDTITMGYGKMNCLGSFKYEVSPKHIREKYGTTLWSEWIKTKNEDYENN